MSKSTVEGERRPVNLPRCPGRALCLSLLAGAILGCAPGEAAPERTAEAASALPWISQGNMVTAGDAAPHHNFGWEVATFGGRLAISTPDGEGTASPTGDGQGTAYVFEWNGVDWEQVEQVFSDQPDANDEFGWSLAIHENTMVVGAFGDETTGLPLSGAVYVFVRDGTSWVLEQKLHAETPQSYGLFGSSVAIWGNTLVVGAVIESTEEGGGQAGAAHVFEREEGSWSYTRRLLAGDGQENDRFGRSVAIWKDTIAVGADGHQETLAAQDIGAVYVFERTGGLWEQTQELHAPDGAANDFFGTAVALSEQTLVASAPRGDDGSLMNCGWAVAFSREGGTWEPKPRLIAGDAASHLYFGNSVAIDDETIVVGAEAFNYYEGAAYVFEPDGVGWAQTQQLLGANAYAQQWFGNRVAASGKLILVGSTYNDHGDPRGSQDTGAAFVFVPAAKDGAPCTDAGECESGFCVDQVCCNIPCESAGSGCSAAKKGWGEDGTCGAIQMDSSSSGATSSGGVGAMGGGGTSGGSASGGAGAAGGPGAGGETSGSTTHATSHDHATTSGVEGRRSYYSCSAAAGEQRERRGLGILAVFGWAARCTRRRRRGVLARSSAKGRVSPEGLSLLAGVLLAGVFLGCAPAGDVPERTEEAASALAWIPEGSIISPDDAAPAHFFGSSVATSKGRLAISRPVGEAVDPVTNAGQGAAYVFERDGAEWSQQGPMFSDVVATDDFGWAVALYDETMVVGADRDSVEAQSSGAVHVFVKDGAGWVRTQKLYAEPPQPVGAFGFSVAIWGGTIVVGAPFESTPTAGVHTGGAHVFERADGTWTWKQLLEPADGQPGEFFGCSVAIRGETIAVGSCRHDHQPAVHDAGSVYVFERRGGTWVQDGDDLVAPNRQDGDQFGFAVAVSEDMVVASAPFGDHVDEDEVEHQECGWAHVFERSGGTWAVTPPKLVPKHVTSWLHFANAVAIDHLDRTILVGSQEAQNGTGLAFVFEPGGSGWTPKQTLFATSSLPQQFFGRSVAASEGLLVVGASAHDLGDTANSKNAGAAFAFVRGAPNGAPCVEAGKCASGYCVDAVCCETACSDLDWGCSAEKKGWGSDGTCGDIRKEGSSNGAGGTGGGANGSTTGNDGPETTSGPERSYYSCAAAPGEGAERWGLALLAILALARGRRSRARS